MLARDSTEKKKFLLWESEENEFETLFKVLLNVHGIDCSKLGKKAMTRFASYYSKMSLFPFANSHSQFEMAGFNYMNENRKQIVRGFLVQVLS